MDFGGVSLILRDGPYAISLPYLSYLSLHIQKIFIPALMGLQACSLSMLVMRAPCVCRERFSKRWKFLHRGKCHAISGVDSLGIHYLWGGNPSPRFIHKNQIPKWLKRISLRKTTTTTCNLKDASKRQTNSGPLISGNFISSSILRTLACQSWRLALSKIQNWEWLGWRQYLTLCKPHSLEI